ncbi:hypothetical protein H7J08_00745 [Mycobacterium frederiksbergense]|jgi:hypothetical protein|uniref:hypothetical protein n=1 Tax=Mycolicibacterium frederiksbergense TaxID=117567 RepID=UPI0021F3670E|nr:hypothetical protein [Mycolicibacterium frederiksbergense]MCV7043205.1 hypothetical protein [Mycolicibacterium frederiksbergense]MDF2713069.1 hypothetical protein [Nonomuraea muscovyensis]
MATLTRTSVATAQSAALPAAMPVSPPRPVQDTVAGPERVEEIVEHPRKLPPTVPLRLR